MLAPHFFNIFAIEGSNGQGKTNAAGSARITKATHDRTGRIPADISRIRFFNVALMKLNARRDNTAYPHPPAR
jgi:hypothetical protein